MKATDLLQQQHREVATLFENIEEASTSQEKTKLFVELASKLCAHDAIEREIFYPACKEEMGLTDQLSEALVEHGFVEFGLYLSNEAAGKDDFDAKCKVLSEIVKHHVEEEEEEFFPEVEKALGAEKLESLAEEMIERFEEATEEDFQAPLYENLRQVMAGVVETDPENAEDAAEDDADDEDEDEDDEDDEDEDEADEEVSSDEAPVDEVAPTQKPRKQAKVR